MHVGPNRRGSAIAQPQVRQGIYIVYIFSASTSLVLPYYSYEYALKVVVGSGLSVPRPTPGRVRVSLQLVRYLSPWRTRLFYNWRNYCIYLHYPRTMLPVMPQTGFYTEHWSMITY